MRQPHPTDVPIGRAHGLVIGIDPALDHHGVVARWRDTSRHRGRRRNPHTNSVSGFHLLAELLHEWRRQAGGALTIAIEETTEYGEALETYLRAEGFALLVVDPLKVARFREAVHRDANDLCDAEAIARFVLVQPDLARPSVQATTADTPQVARQRHLRQLARRHQRWVRERTATANELHAVLRKAWLADYQEFFSEIDGATALDFWQTYPTPPDAAVADPAALAERLRHASRGWFNAVRGTAKAAEIQSLAHYLVVALGRADPQRWTAWAADIQALARHLAWLKQLTTDLEHAMQAELAALASPLGSLKAMGPVLAATIHGEVLAVTRFPSADHFARYNGTAPREDSSGRRPRHIRNWRCNQRLRWALRQYALLAARGVTGGPALLRLARRLSDIIYALLKHGRPYDLNYFLEHRRHPMAA
jgi:transposase